MIETLIVLLGVFGFLYIIEKISQKSALGALLISLLSCFAVLIIFQNELVYTPVIPLTSRHAKDNPPGYRHPTEFGLNTYDIQIQTEDGVSLKGWLISKKTNKHIIVYFHENAGNLGIRMNYLKHLHEETESDILLVAYRGFSDSEGKPTEKGIQRDAKAILKFAVNYLSDTNQGKSKKDLFVLGRSMGGAVAIYSSTLEQFKSSIRGFIIENTFCSIPDLLSSLFHPLSLLNPFLRNKWPSMDRIAFIQQPILFVRSIQDETIPTEQMQKLFNFANMTKMKQQYVIANGKHNIWWELDPVGYSAALNTFFEETQKITDK